MSVISKYVDAIIGENGPRQLTIAKEEWSQAAADRLDYDINAFIAEIKTALAVKEYPLRQAIFLQDGDNLLVEILWRNDLA